MPSFSFTGIHSPFVVHPVGEDLVSSRLPRNTVSGRSGRYKIDPYTIAVSLNDTIANEKEGTRPSPTKRYFGDAEFASDSRTSGENERLQTGSRRSFVSVTWGFNLGAIAPSSAVLQLAPIRALPGSEDEESRDQSCVQ